MMRNMSDSKFALEKRIARHINSLPPSGIRKFFDLVSTMDDVISLGVGEPDFVTPWNIREGGIYSLERGRTSYTSNLGTLALRREICRYVAENYHLDYKPETECLVTVGVSEALDVAIRAITDPGDEIIYASPCFVSYPAEIVMAHGVPVPVKCECADHFALDPAKIEAAITPRTKAVLINFPCNPTGATLDEKRQRELAEVIIRHDLLLITDEIYSELVYDAPHTSVAALPGMRERTIFLHGFSKAFAMTGWRIGYACAPAELVDAMKKVHQYAIMCAPTVAQFAALEALREGIVHRDEMRDSYLARRNLFVKGLNDIGLKCHVPAGAFYAFPSVAHTGLSDEEFATQLLEKQHVAVVPGSAFGAGGENFVRCSYATSEEGLLRALERMQKFLATLGV